MIRAFGARGHEPTLARSLDHVIGFGASRPELPKVGDVHYAAILIFNPDFASTPICWSSYISQTFCGVSQGMVLTG
jgi:hypothetical protein